MPTIGQKLEETRRRLDLSIEDVAHETRIHPSMIALIEDDDFSRFPSVSYAKSFIRKYSNHLGVDLEAAMEALDAGEAGKLGDNEWMGEMKRTIQKDRLVRGEPRPRLFRKRPGKPGGAPLFLNFLLLALIAALGVFYFLGFNAATPEAAKEEIVKGLKKANPFANETAAQAGPEIPSNPLHPADPAVALTRDGAANPGAGPLSPPAVRSEATEEGEAPSAPKGVETPASASPPGYPVIKPEVSLKFDDTLGRDSSDSAAAEPVKPVVDRVEKEASLRPRETPRLEIVEEALPPLRADDLPAVRKAVPEPQAQLRPEGTDPAATSKREAEPGRSPEPGASPKPEDATKPATKEPDSAQPVRAVPVAASE